MQQGNFFRGMLLGLATGDALGVPHEFKSRQALAQNPVTGMEGYGTHHQPPGTWSDDTSLALCTADAIAENFNVNRIATNFKLWLCSGLWTARGRVFDVGITTQNAIYRLEHDVSPELAGGTEESDNGNGSLMRILPVLKHTFQRPPGDRFEVAGLVSSITHRHIRSVIACFYLLEFARELVISADPYICYLNVQKTVTRELQRNQVPEYEIVQFERLLGNDITRLKSDQIQSTGYVLHTLEASIWCILTTKTFGEAVLTAVNLGEDTDTTGAVTGGLAGIIYGNSGIPGPWLKQLAKRDEIENLAERLYQGFLLERHM